MARILLAEDDPSVRGFVARALEMDGHAVLTAEDGGLAAEAMLEHEAILICCYQTSNAGDGWDCLGPARGRPISRCDNFAYDRLCRSARARTWT